MANVSFNRRLQAQFKKRQQQFERDPCVQILPSKHERKPKILQILSTATKATALVLLFVAVLTGVQDEDSMLSIVLTLISIVLTLLFVAIQESRISEEYCSAMSQDSTEPGPHTNPLPSTPANVRLYLRCIALACDLETEEHTYKTAESLNNLLIEIEGYRERLDQLATINDMNGYEAVANALESFEKIIANCIQQTINVLVGCGANAFIEQGEVVAKTMNNIHEMLAQDFITIVEALDEGKDLGELNLHLYSFIKDNRTATDDDTSDDDDSADEDGDGDIPSFASSASAPSTFKTRFAAMLQRIDDRLYTDEDDCIKVNPHNVHILIACVLSSCTAPEDEPVAEAAKALKACEDDLRGIRTSFNALGKMNNLPAADEFISLCDAAAMAIATACHSAINTLIGVGPEAFVTDATPLVVTKCTEICESLDGTLESLAMAVIYKNHDLDNILIKIRSLTIAYRQLATQDFPTAKPVTIP